MSKLQLNSALLSRVHKDTLTPQYNPANHKSGIVHIGIGAFHKAHHAVFTDDVLNKHGGDWRITAVSLRRPIARDQLQPQDNLYTVVEKSETGAQHRIIGAVEKVLVCPEQPNDVIDALAHDNIKVVTLTVTEKGYCQKKGKLDEDNEDIRHDLELFSGLTNLNGNEIAKLPLKTMPALIVAACAERRNNQQQGFSVVSCDNLPHNGVISKNVVLGFAEKISPDLTQWIEQSVTFCSTMVDRIVPATTPQALSDIESFLGVSDEAAVICEPFRQWVIEDNFVAGRPQWEDAGALLVNDVGVFEDMKLRLLNGSHSALAYLGFLCGLTYIHEAVNDLHLNKIVKAMMDIDTTPSLQVPDGFDLEAYKSIILDRFANSEVPYKTTQVACDGSQKLPQRLLSVAQFHIEKGNTPKVIPLVIAAWFNFLEGQDNHGEKHAVNDPMADALCPIALSLRHDEEKQVAALIEASQIFPDALRQNSHFVASITEHLKQIHKEGVLNTVKALGNAGLN